MNCYFTCQKLSKFSITRALLQRNKLHWPRLIWPTPCSLGVTIDRVNKNIINIYQFVIITNLLFLLLNAVTSRNNDIFFIPYLQIGL